MRRLSSDSDTLIPTSRIRNLVPYHDNNKSRRQPLMQNNLEEAYLVPRYSWNSRNSEQTCSMMLIVEEGREQSMSVCHNAFETEKADLDCPAHISNVRAEAETVIIRFEVVFKNQRTLPSCVESTRWREQCLYTQGE